MTEQEALRNQLDPRGRLINNLMERHIHDQRIITALLNESPMSIRFAELRAAIAVAEVALGNVGDGDWTPQDTALRNLIDALHHSTILAKEES